MGCCPLKLVVDEAKKKIGIEICENTQDKETDAECCFNSQCMCINHESLETNQDWKILIDQTYVVVKFQTCCILTCDACFGEKKKLKMYVMHRVKEHICIPVYNNCWCMIVYSIITSNQSIWIWTSHDLGAGLRARCFYRGPQLHTLHPIKSECIFDRRTRFR